MKALVVYDSLYGNTEKIAKAIGEAIEAKTLKVSEANLSELASFNLLIVGSPVQGGRATKAVQDFLGKIPANALKNVNIASFDTRFSPKEKGFGIRILIKVFGYAAGRIAQSLQSKGGHLVTQPEGFIVEGKEGPLREGELERAAQWGKEIVKKQMNV
jgi:flavodoxin I